MTKAEMQGGQLAILLAVVELHRRAGRVTVADVADAVGCCKTQAHRMLRRLREGGWVAWTDHQQGTLHPRVRRVL